MAGWQAARLEEIDELDDGRCPYRPVRHHLGITTFGATAWTARAAGDRIINEHDETDPTSSDELYLVMSGAARFELDDESLEAPAGTFVRVEPGVTRTAFAQEAGTTILAVGGAPEGRAYQVEGWEVIAPLVPLFQARREEEAIARLNAMLEEGTRYPSVLYCLACAESLTGQTQAALGHLRAAVQLMPDVAEFARDDEDLSALRGEPEFAEIVGPPRG